MGKPQLYSSPLPLRAIGDQRLAGLDFRILAAIAAYDRMSAARGDGQGCWASHGTLAAKVGCDYSNLSKSIKKLGELGYIERSKPTFGDKRSHVYRVSADLYGVEESLSFHQPSAAPKAANCDIATENVGDLTNPAGKVVGHADLKNGANLPENDSQYISQSDVRYSAEAVKDTPVEQARLTSRGLREEERELSDGAQLAMFERAIKDGSPNLDLRAWIEWLDVAQDRLCGEPLGRQAQRLFEAAVDALPEDDYAAWQAGEWDEREESARAGPIAGPQLIRAQVSNAWQGLDTPARRWLAQSASITPAELRDYVGGRLDLNIPKQAALRSAVAHLTAQAA